MEEMNPIRQGMLMQIERKEKEANRLADRGYRITITALISIATLLLILGLTDTLDHELSIGGILTLIVVALSSYFAFQKSVRTSLRCHRKIMSIMKKEYEEKNDEKLGTLAVNFIATRMESIVREKFGTLTKDSLVVTIIPPHVTDEDYFTATVRFETDEGGKWGGSFDFCDISDADWELDATRQWLNVLVEPVYDAPKTAT